MRDLLVRELKQAEWDRWDEWLALQSWGSPFSSAWWLESSCRAFGGRPLLLGVLDRDRLVGGVALRITDNGPLHVVRPSIIYNPIVMADSNIQVAQEALEALLQDIAVRRLVVRPLKSTPNVVDLREATWNQWELTASWTVVTALKTWELERDTSRAKLKQMRKAHRAGVVAGVEPCDSDVLYSVLWETILRHGHEPSLTRKQLGILIEGAGSHGIQTVARGADGTPLSAGFTMAHGTGIAYDIWWGTSAAGLSTGAGAMRAACVLRELQNRGYEYFDWCDATPPGYSDFKLEFGGDLMTCLSISRQPLWLKAATATRERLLRAVSTLKRH